MTSRILRLTGAIGGLAGLAIPVRLVAQSAISVSISPGTVTLQEGSTQVFTATVTNDPNNLGVSWVVGLLIGGKFWPCTGAPACGGLTPTSPTTALYTPTPLPTVNLIRAMSVADKTKYATAIVRVNPPPPPPCPPPTFSPPPGTYNSPLTVTISDSTAGASVYYTTDGLPPNTTLPAYTGPITVGTTETINALAITCDSNHQLCCESPVASATYTVTTPPSNASTPTFSPPPGTYASAQTVTISDATPGASIYYTTDGSTPTVSSTLYTGPILVRANATISAIAVVAGTSASPVASATYAINSSTTTSPPIFSPPPGTYTSAQTVTISDATPGASIYYTTDGSTPTVSSTLYAGPITVETNETITAIAVAPGYSASSVASATYNVKPSLGAANFVPLTPCRVADTRNADGAFGGPSMAGGTSRDFAIPNSACGIPSSATAYSLNVAVVPHGPLGYLTAWPAGTPPPLVDTLNSWDGRVKSNAAIVAAGENGAISIFVSGATDVILDINGYFTAASPSALAFYPVTPCRIADTRNPAGPLGGPSLAGQQTRAFPIPSSSCGVPSNAQAYSLNFAVVPTRPLGYLTAWAAGQPQPLVASLNAVTGTVTANAAIVPAGENGEISVFVTDPTDLVIDIDGYFAPPGPGGLSFYHLAPCRVKDTRQPPGTPPFIGTVDVNITASGCEVPSTAAAYVLGVTVVPPGPLGYLTMWPQGEPQPLVATLNAVDGAATSNMAIVSTTTGSVSVFATDPAQMVLDIFGYFASTPGEVNPAPTTTTPSLPSAPAGY